MTYIPSTADLLDLNAQLGEDGFSAHDFTIVKLVSVARSLDAPKELVATLANTSLPEMTRQRALGELASVWASYAVRSDCPSSNFANLLDTWRAHHDLRKNGGSVAELFDSRIQLDLTRRNYRAGAVPGQKADTTTGCCA